MAQVGLLKRLQHQTGAGMVEVLIALVISAFALLGLAGLQVSSMRYQKGANFRALSTQYAAEMADRIRANLTGARSAGAGAGGKYNFPLENYTSSAPSAPSSNPCDGSNPAACDPAALAAQDLYNWRVTLNRGLAGGWGEVSGDAIRGLTIRVYFNEPTSTTPDPNCRAGAGAGPQVRCFVTVFYP
jgi:type IV pilus assembly protein PilV